MSRGGGIGQRQNGALGAHLRSAFAEVCRRGAGCLTEFQHLPDGRAQARLDRLKCPVTGPSVREAWEAERALLQPVPTMAEPFDLVVTRKVQRDCLVSFEERRYSVPFWGRATPGRLGTQASVVIRAEGADVVRHARRTPQRLLIDPAHYDGPSIDRVQRPTPLGQLARLQMTGPSSGSKRRAAAGATS